MQGSQSAKRLFQNPAWILNNGLLELFEVQAFKHCSLPTPPVVRVLQGDRT